MWRDGKASGKAGFGSPGMVKEQLWLAAPGQSPSHLPDLPRSRVHRSIMTIGTRIRLI
jgi:hypothetical protein